MQSATRFKRAAAVWLYVDCVLPCSLCDVRFVSCDEAFFYTFFKISHRYMLHIVQNIDKKYKSDIIHSDLI